MRRIGSFVPAATVMGAVQSRPGVDVPSRARRRSLRGVDPLILRLGAVHASPPAHPPRPSS